MQQTNQIKTIEQVKNQIERRPVIDSVTVYEKEVYLSYSDTEIQTDYHNGYSLGIKEATDELRKWGGAVVQVHTNGGYSVERYDEITKIMKRIEKMAKKADYINEVTIKTRYQEFSGIRQEWLEISGTLVRK